MDARINFHTLPIGAKFHLGKNGDQMMIFEKTDKRKGVCIKQLGYGNTRWEGNFKAIAPHATVYKWEQ